MTYGLFTTSECLLGWNEPGRVGTKLKITSFGTVSLKLFFPRPSSIYGARHKSLDEYDFSCVEYLLDSIGVGERINLRLPDFIDVQTMVKLETESADGTKQWRVSWSLQTPWEQFDLASELANVVFYDTESLWFTGESLLRAKEYAALPQPRPAVHSISLLNGAVESEAGEGEAGESEAGESEAGESAAGESEAGESEAGESEAGESEAGESEARGESEAGESEAGESNYPTDEVTAELLKGRRVVGSFHGRAGDTLGVWSSYLRFDPAGDEKNAQFLARGDFVETPNGARAVLMRILGGKKVGGNRAQTAEHACFVCLLYRPDSESWRYATLPQVTQLWEEADATLIRSIEDKLRTFTPVGVSAAISQAHRAAGSKEPRSGSGSRSGAGKRARDESDEGAEEGGE